MRGAMGEAISAFELIGRQILDLLLAFVPGHEDPMADRHQWYVLVEVAGQGAPGTLAEPFAAALGSAMEKGLVIDAMLATTTAQSRRFWKMREDMAEATKNAGGAISHDISVPVSRIADYITATDAAVRRVEPGTRIVCFGHVGDGNLHYNLVRPDGWDRGDWKARRAEMNRIVHDSVIAHSGAISAEHGIGRLRLAENEHYKSDVEIDLMRTLKAALDPKGIINPGKVVRMPG